MFKPKFFYKLSRFYSKLILKDKKMATFNKPVGQQFKFLANEWQERIEKSKRGSIVIGIQTCYLRK